MPVKFLNLPMMDNTPVVSNSMPDPNTYPDNTVGSVMTRSFITLDVNQTVEEALETIRLDAPVKDTIYFAYILDHDNHIVGTVSLRDLILANQEDSLGDIMATHIVFCTVTDHQSEAARLIGVHDLLALPVLDESGQMVGIVMHDDAFDVATEDSTEDQLKLGAIGKLSGSIKNASISALYRMRVGWLV